MIRYSHFQIGQTLISVSNLNLGKRTNDFRDGLEFVAFVYLSTEFSALLERQADKGNYFKV